VVEGHFLGLGCYLRLDDRIACFIIPPFREYVTCLC
jgi:hypothetical protein